MHRNRTCRIVEKSKNLNISDKQRYNCGNALLLLVINFWSLYIMRVWWSDYKYICKLIKTPKMVKKKKGYICHDFLIIDVLIKLTKRLCLAYNFIFFITTLWVMVQICVVRLLIIVRQKQSYQIKRIHLYTHACIAYVLKS